jgi:lysozyme
MTNFYKGYDISVIQGTVQFDLLAQQGTKFIISRCAVGNSGTDINYTKNIAGTKNAGMLPMAYNFAFPLPPLASQPTRDPVVQAQLHFKAAAGELASLDLEWPVENDWKKWGCSANQIVEWTLTYLQEYERLSGKKIPIYTYPNFMQTIGNPAQFADYPLWIASYQANSPMIPKPWNSYVLWQNSGGTAKLPNGVNVDTDLAIDLSLWGVQTPRMTGTSVPTVNTAPQTPPPPPGTPLNTMLDVQHALNLLGGAGTPLTEDGNNGPKTIAAIEAFQASHGLTADGIPGSATKTVLQAAVASITPVVAPLPAVVAAPDPIHPVNPAPIPDAVAPSPARPPHPTLPPNFWNSVLNLIVNFAKNVLHI